MPSMHSTLGQAPGPSCLLSGRVPNASSHTHVNCRHDGILSRTSGMKRYLKRINNFFLEKEFILWTLDQYGKSLSGLLLSAQMFLLESILKSWWGH